MRAATDPLELVADMTRDFAASRDIEATLARALARIADWVGAEAASLFLRDEASGDLTCQACVGPVDITGLRVPAGAGIVGRTVADNSVRMVRDARLDPAFGAAIDQRTGFLTRSVLCAPMAVGAARLGAIELINKRGGGGLFEVADGRLLSALAGSAGLALLNARLAAAMAAQERLTRELELAAEIQRGMLPGPAAEGAAVAGINLPAGAVSGDFFDILTLADGRVAFTIGDVSGKGVNAALLMARTSSLFRCLAKRAAGPARLLAAINAELCETGGLGMFVTMTAGLFEPAGGRVVLANAGHEPALLRRPDGHITALPAAGPPLGIAVDLIGDDLAEDVIELAGGCLYLFTDGLTEAPVAAGGWLGAEGVRRLIADHAGLPASRRPAAMAAAVAGPGTALRDDLTLLLVEDLRP